MHETPRHRRDSAGRGLGPAQALQYWPAQEQDDAPPSYDAHGHALAVDEQGLVYVDRQDRPVLRPFIYDNGRTFSRTGWRVTWRTARWGSTMKP